MIEPDERPCTPPHARTLRCAFARARALRRAFAARSVTRSEAVHVPLRARLRRHEGRPDGARADLPRRRHRIERSHLLWRERRARRRRRREHLSGVRMARAFGCDREAVAQAPLE